MTERDPDYVSEEEAAKLWRRAAQLQAEAAQRAEAAAHETERASLSTPTTSDGYHLAHVRSAATEAGIGGEFVEAALYRWSLSPVL